MRTVHLFGLFVDGLRLTSKLCTFKTDAAFKRTELARHKLLERPKRFCLQGMPHPGTLSLECLSRDVKIHSRIYGRSYVMAIIASRGPISLRCRYSRAFYCYRDYIGFRADPGSCKMSATTRGFTYCAVCMLSQS